MIIYAESSAVVAWLIREPRADEAAAVLGQATRVVTSALTRVECSRALARGAALGRITRRQAAELLRDLDETLAGWDLVELTDRVLGVASSPFPVEPIRALDAIHVASARIAHASLRDVGVLAFDERVRANANALGLVVLPREA